ncbi:hypothetical protein SAMN04487968_10347 [Nocardioides terrae]|uniref:DUF7489 domain-containing protein n=1 Tax=Nocardioides terrae TaxID=574651 RepID=A0A1I1FMS6_9ACTN|nr:hypothetical protein [Nocardioides terrae]SFC00292.1 hypothetical protein SAMN04487968_10347 [Nocardioides terrae]
MSDQSSWSGVVVKKSRGLLDGSNLYRRLTIRHDDGTESKVRVGRALWNQIDVGDRVLKEAGGDPHRT